MFADNQNHDTVFAARAALVEGFDKLPPGEVEGKFTKAQVKIDKLKKAENSSAAIDYTDCHIATDFIKATLGGLMANDLPLALRAQPRSSQRGNL
jgi:hypothetical protein